MNRIEINQKLLNTIKLNCILLGGFLKKRREPVSDLVIPEGYKEYETADGEIYQASNGRYYIKQ